MFPKFFFPLLRQSDYKNFTTNFVVIKKCLNLIELKSAINSSCMRTADAYTHELSLKYISLFCIFTSKRGEAYHQILSCKWAHSESTRSFPPNKLLAFVSKYGLYIHVEWVRQRFKTELTLVLFAHSCGIEELKTALQRSWIAEVYLLLMKTSDPVISFLLQWIFKLYFLKRIERIKNFPRYRNILKYELWNRFFRIFNA